MLIGNLWSHWTDVGYYNDTSCIMSNNTDAIESIIANILEKEGYISISKPKLPTNNKLLLSEILSRPYLIRSLIIVGLLNSNTNWITIKTSISKLLCHTGKHFDRSLISELAIESSCDAFHHHVFERYYGVLLEANANGQTFASGYIDCDERNEMVLLNKSVAKTTKEQNFFLLDVPKEFKDAGQVKFHLNELEKQRKEEELEALFNEQPGQAQLALSEWKKLHMSWFERTDEDLEKLICKSNSFWHENNLLYKAYTEPNELEKDEVKLLFFISKDHNVEEIWLPITSKEDFGIEQDIPW